jgi:2'-5' RNA ligase
MSEQYKPTGETAIIIVPPPDICAYADHYRSLYMPEIMHNIEPHITVLGPFVPYDQLQEAEPKLREALAECPPRRLSLRSFGMFREGGVLFLQLADPERVRSIYRAIFARFPGYPAYGGHERSGGGDDWHPHMTVGVFSELAELEKVYTELAVQRLYMGFEVERVVVKAQMDDGIWDTWAELPLGEEIEQGC